jgi:16S rRNA (guanine527-N7)-methyltransferase
VSGEDRALAKLVRAHALPATVRVPLAALLDALAGDDAPTTVHARPEAIGAHLADSLVALELDEVAGAGLPGLALAAALPAAHVSLIESTRRKCTFLERAVESMGLQDRAVVVCERVEAWPAGTGRFDLAVARALASLPVLVEYAAPLLRMGGSLVAWKGRRVGDEERAGAAAAEVLGMEVVEVRKVRPYAGAHNRHLYVFRKAGPTPPEYPRRPGMAVKRPIARSGSDRVPQ